MSNLSIPNGIQTGKMLPFAGTELEIMMTTTVLCALVSVKKIRVDIVSGIVSAKVSQTVFFQ